MSVFKAADFKKAYGKLKLGMTKDDVIQMLGEPNAQKARNGIEIYSWWSREFKGLLRGGSIERKIIVEFENGIVCGFDGENIDASIL